MLEKIYSTGLLKGLITGTFQEWRQEVIERINILFGMDYKEMTDSEIMKYLEEEPYEKLIEDSILRVVR